MNKCEVCGRTENEGKIHKYKGNFLCRKHRDQFMKYDKYFDNNKRTILDPNEYIIQGEEVIIKLYDNFGNELDDCVIIDKDDLYTIKNLKIGIDSNGYVRCYNNLLHRKIMKVIDSRTIVDHIDRNPLNNKKSNLRLSDKSKNGMNRLENKNNTSGFRGVSWNKKSKKWEVYLNKDRKRIKLGYHENKEDAIKARLEAEYKYFGEFAPQKELFQEYGIGVD